MFFFKAEDKQNGWLGTGGNWEQTRHKIPEQVCSIYSLRLLSSQAPHSITLLISPLSFWERPFYISQLLYKVYLFSLNPPNFYQGASLHTKPWGPEEPKAPPPPAWKLANLLMFDLKSDKTHKECERFLLEWEKNQDYEWNLLKIRTQMESGNPKSFPKVQEMLLYQIRGCRVTTAINAKRSISEGFSFKITSGPACSLAANYS